MLFNTFNFAYFFLALFPTYWALSRYKTAQNLLLLSAGYFFYSCWEPRFLWILILSTLVDFACGLAVDRIEAPRPRKLFVIASMALNLGMLGYFKYFDFFAESLQVALAKGGMKVSLWQVKTVLPIGISFYTFQSMSYVIDVYRRDIKPTKNLLEFATFVSFFPHLVAGPIMRPTTLLPQIQSPRRFNLDQFYQGVYLIFWGLTKKVVISDNLAPIVDDLFGKWQTIDGGLAMVAVYAFAFQIYCDFSGYTDIARGVSKCLGIDLALNFNLPYFAANPQEFWNRWHISLSRWLQDYLYIPLGGSRGGNFNTYKNLMLTMIIGGLWHGAAWTFVIWGTYQGTLLIVHRLLKPWLAKVNPVSPIDQACWKAVRIFATFHLVCLGWLIFRAKSTDQLLGMLKAIFDRPAVPASAFLLPVMVIIIPLLIVQFAQYITKDLDIIARTPWYIRSVFYTICFYAIVIGANFGGSQFIYFQF